MRDLNLPLENLKDVVRRLRAQHELPLKTPLGRDDLVYQVVNAAAEVSDAMGQAKAIAQASNVVFSIDPSSTCTGWAVMKPQLKLVASGRLLPPNTKADAHDRIDAMCLILRRLLDQYTPRTILIEWTTGHRARRLGKNVSHLAIYGVAIGALWREAVGWTENLTSLEVPAVVMTIPENLWTGGRPKQRTARSKGISRQEIIVATYPQYDPEKDLGADEADAIGLNVWWQEEQRVRTL